MTLYVIGNGFDLHHEIEFRYSNFQKYLYHINESSLVGQIETYYPSIVNSRDYKWGDLEKALGEIDYIATYKDCNEDIEIDYDHMMRTAAILEDNPQQVLDETLDRLYINFTQWVNSLDIKTEKDDDLYSLFSMGGLFLNFNYTETLEETYGIPRSSITYIHGCRNSNDTLILGHGVEIDSTAAFSEDNTIYEDNAYQGIMNVANMRKKDIDKIINSKGEFWKSLKDVNRIITYGHSLSDVDIPYFRMIFGNANKNSEWHFGYYSETDKERCICVAKDLGINRDHYSCFNF